MKSTVVELSSHADSYVRASCGFVTYAAHLTVDWVWQYEVQIKHISGAFQKYITKHISKNKVKQLFEIRGLVQVLCMVLCIVVR